MVQYNFREIKEFIHLLEGDSADWAEPTKKWLQRCVFAQAQAEAVKNLASSDSAEPLDVTEVSRMTEIYRQTINQRLLNNKGDSAAFEEACKARSRFISSVQYHMAHHFWNRFRKGDKGETENRCNLRFNQTFSLEELAAVACRRYVEDGLGTEEDARKYFFG